jgi:hypothetical protein
VTVRAIGGLVVFNLFIFGVGVGVLWGLRGWRWWTELLRLAGVAYLLGLSALMTLLTFEIVIGLPIGVLSILASGAGLTALGVVAGRLRGFTTPRLRPDGWQFPGISVLAAVFVAGIVVYFESLFRAERLSGIAREWDSWTSWIPKAKGLYVSGRLEPELLSLIQHRPSYPPGLATIQAGAFHAMGSADTVTLHLQYWFFAVGFVLAVIGLLANRVHHAILFPVLLAFLVAPSLVEWVTTVYADIPLGYLVAVAALLIILWIEERHAWQLAASTVLLAGAMLTKREGTLFVACVLLAGFVASWPNRGDLWKRLVVAALVAFALVLPWRIWFVAHGYPSDGPEAGYLGVFSHVDRLWPSLKLNVTTLSDGSLWHHTPALGIAAIVLALLARAWRISSYAVVFVVGAVAAGTWVFWSNLSLALTRDEWAARRFAGTTVLVLAVLTPLLLQGAWSSISASRAARTQPPGQDVLFRRSRVAWIIVLVGLLSHPGAILVGYSGSGLPGGRPTFPGTAGCGSAPVDGANIRVVVAYADSFPEAMSVRARARAAGLADVEARQDGCGHVQVFVDGLPSIEASQTLVDMARAAGLEPKVGLEPDE